MQRTIRSIVGSLAAVAACVTLASPAGRVGAQGRGYGIDDFFDDSAVRDIRLVVNSRDWTALKQNFSENTYYPCTLTWSGLSVRNVGIRSRGSGSRSGTKPGLRVDFDRYSAAQTFLGMKSFVLDNLVQDGSMLRERLSMLFFRRMGVPAPRETHVRLFVNDSYAGIYAAVEAIDKGFLGRTFGADDQGKVENDGYLFEYDWIRDYRFEYLGDDLAEYRMFKPQTRERDAASQIWGPVEEMVRAINEAPSALFVEDVSRYLDLELFARYLAIEAFIAENDGILGAYGLNNFYLYRFERSTRSQFLPWDKDNAFIAPDFPILQGVADNVLARRTLAERRFMDAYLNTLLAAADSAAEPEQVEPEPERDAEAPSPGWLEREIRREYAQVRDATWDDPYKPFTSDEFEESVEGLLAFARRRSAFVRAEVERLRR